MSAKLLVTTLLFIFISGTLWAQDGKVNFSGEWSLNTEQSTLSENGFQPATLRISQQGNTLSVERVYSREYQDDFVINEDLTLDGKENKSDTQFSSRVSTAKWDGSTLIIASKLSFERNGNEFTMNTEEAWTLKAKDVLSIAASSHSSRGDNEATLVYQKEE